MLFTGLTITNWFSLLLQHTFLLAPTNFVRFLDFASKSIETNHHPLYLFILTHLVCVACVRILYLVWHRISSLKHIQNQHLSTLKAAESPNLFYPHSKSSTLPHPSYFFSLNKKRTHLLGVWLVVVKDIEHQNKMLYKWGFWYQFST